MSWLSELAQSIVESAPTPTVNNMNVNPISLVTGTGLPIIQRNTAPTEEQKKQQAQVKTKMDFAEKGDDVGYLQYLYNQQFQGFDPNPESYKGTPTGEQAMADAQRIAQRNSTMAGQQNARLGKMGATKGADSMRMAVENSLYNQEALNANDSLYAGKEYQSKVNEMLQNANKRDTIGQKSVSNQIGRANALQEGWQGQLGRFGKSVVESGGMPIMPAIGAGIQALGNNDSYFREKLGNTTIDAANLMLDPNESVRQIQKKYTEQAGRPAPMVIDPSKIRR
jgi:hypothetical protein